MSLVGIASEMDVTPHTLDQLISGNVLAGVAGRLGDTPAALQQFVNGGTSVGLAYRMGCTPAALQGLRNAIGEQGAIGLLIGLCIPPRT